MAAQLRVEPLEPRDVPATFGTPWPDGEHLTLSFAPDGTSILGAASDLSAHDPNAGLAVLRAFQAWAVNANLNIGLVADSGAAFGTGGAVPGAPRFGDVRVGGRALAPDVLAVTAPYQRFDNYSGDIVLNTAADFGAGGYDLFTAVLQEAGHALGVGNSPDVSSAMYEFYQGARTGPSAGDVASIRALYGARQPDKYERANGNDTLATATAYPALAGPVAADLTTATEVDVYEFTAESLTDRVTVSLRAAGLSLVTARVELLDAAGRVLASGVAADPMHNDVTLSLGAVRPGGTYFVRVSAAQGDEFAVGSYELEVTQSSPPGAGAGTGDVLVTAHARLQGELALSARGSKNASAFDSSRGSEIVQVVAPPSTSGEPINLLLTVWGDGRATNPWIEVTDAHGRTFDADVLTADGNTTTLLIRGPRAGQTYFVKAFSDSPLADVHFAADWYAEVAPPPELAAGGLSNGASASFALAQSGQVRLVLAATGAVGSAEAVVTDAAGREVGRFATEVCRGRSLDVFLNAGTYTVTVRAVGGSQLVFRLGMAIVTDPIGVRPEDPTSAPPSLAPPPNQSVAQPPRPQTASPPVSPAVPPSQPPPVTPFAPTLVPISPVPPQQSMWLPAGVTQPPSAYPPTLVWGKTAPAEPIEYVWWY